MMLKQRSRRRGVILTSQGLHKLQDAKSESESNENCDKRYTREALGFRTGLDPDTVAKVFAREIGVDKQTLTYCFRAFNLQLDSDRLDPTATMMKSMVNSFRESEKLPIKAA